MLRGDNLIPLSESVLNDKIVDNKNSGKNKEDEAIEWDYKWNKEIGNPYADFKKRGLNKDAIIQPGEYIDRIGSKIGSYACPLKYKIYSIWERALPYLFVEEMRDIIGQPCYHIFKVIKEISYDILIKDKAIDKDIKSLIMKNGGVCYGDVATVKGFGAQGIGGGKQYRFPISIALLEEYGYLEEIGKKVTE